MADPFIGEIRAMGFNFAPRGWAECNGQLLPISSNEALFSLLGTIYGGDGRTTFALPDLRGRSMLHKGRGPGLNDKTIGARGGREYITLTANELPAHSHTGHVKVADQNGATFNATNAYLARRAIDIDVTPVTTVEMYVKQADATFGLNTNVAGVQTNDSGGGQAFSSRSPYQVVNLCIATVGLFPSRS